MGSPYMAASRTSEHVQFVKASADKDKDYKRISAKEPGKD